MKETVGRHEILGLRGVLRGVRPAPHLLRMPGPERTRAESPCRLANVAQSIGSGVERSCSCSAGDAQIIWVGWSVENGVIRRAMPATPQYIWMEGELRPAAEGVVPFVNAG